MGRKQNTSRIPTARSPAVGCTLLCSCAGLRVHLASLLLVVPLHCAALHVRLRPSLSHQLVCNDGRVEGEKDQAQWKSEWNQDGGNFTDISGGYHSTQAC